MSELSRVAALLLAAGRSRRMGAFKPLLPFGRNHTVAQTCVANLREAGIERIVIVVGHREEDVRQNLSHFDIHFAVNREAESEMTVSIKRGIERLPDDFTDVLIHLVDLPGVSGETIREIASAPPVIEGKPRLIVPEYGGRGGHPVLIDLTYRTELLNLDPTRGLRSLFDEQHGLVRRLTVNSPYIIRDMDTPEDYRNLHNEIFGFAPLLNE